MPQLQNENSELSANLNVLDSKTGGYTNISCNSSGALRIEEKSQIPTQARLHALHKISFLFLLLWTSSLLDIINQPLLDENSTLEKI